MNDKIIWDKLYSAGLNAYGVAGMMGNLFAESGLKPDNLQDSFEKKLGFTDETYTKAVDNGYYTNFARDGAGYGLAQWTYHTRKQGLLDFAKERGVSISDLDMQLDYLIKELRESYPSLLRQLAVCGSVRAASDAVLKQFEQPADQSEAVQVKRATYGLAYYKFFATGETTQSRTEHQWRALAVETAREWIGAMKGSDTHKAIIDLYNTQKSLPRGYKVKYTDAWCAATVSAVAIKTGLTDIIPCECGVEEMIKLFKAHPHSVWQENENYRPQAGDLVFYDWDDRTDYASTDNQGWADHVGIVERVEGDVIIVIEGNKNNAVGRRSVNVNGRYLRGFGLPAYARKATNFKKIGKIEITDEKDAANFGEVKYKMTGKEIYDALQSYLATLEVPEWAQKEYNDAVESGITDGSNPMQLIPRYQAALMAYRAAFGDIED